MTTTSALRRPTLRLAAVSAAALLALTGCANDPQNGSVPPSGQGADGAITSSGSPTAGSEASSSGSASAEPSASGSESSAESTAAALEATAGTCFHSEPGIRDLASFTEVDCAEEHTAEYLWAVPAEAAEEGTDTEAACRAMAERYGAEIDATVSATELRDSSDMSQHCVLYTITDPWTGQVVDSDITLEAAQAEL